MASWRRWLVDEPRGWRPGEPEGSIRYSAADLSAFTDPDGQPVPVVLFAGRFMRFKRLQLLIEAHHVMRSTTACRSVLVVAGGFPCEWEGEHPYDTVRRLGRRRCVLRRMAGSSRPLRHLELQRLFAAPSVDEPFGLVYLEAMASGVPPIGTTTGGPLSFINVDPDRPTGWLVPPDDVGATAGALAEAVSDPACAAERGRRCAQFVRENFSWAASAKSFARSTTSCGCTEAIEALREHGCRRRHDAEDRRRVGVDGADPVVGHDVQDQLVVAHLGPQRVVSRDPA